MYVAMMTILHGEMNKNTAPIKKILLRSVMTKNKCNFFFTSDCAITNVKH